MSFRAHLLRPTCLSSILAATTLLCALVAPARAQSVDTRFWVTDGVINATAQSGDTLYVGGNFTYLGPNTGSGTPISLATGVPVANSPRVDGLVLAVVSDGAGGWYLGGLFTKVGGVTRRHLAHLLPDLSLDTWDPAPDDAVLALAVSGSTVYAGGTFSTIGGQSRAGIAALDAETGLASAWAPQADGPVQALAVDGETLYAGGQFTHIGGQPRSRIAALDTATGLATAWAPDANGFVQALAVSGPVVYVGGGFTSIGGQLRTNLAAIDAASGLATAWSADANGFVQALAVNATAVYAGGGFTTIHAAARNHLAALDPATGTPTAWDPSADNVVQALALQGGTVYAAGYFSLVGGQSRRFLAAIDGTSGAPLAWQADANSNIRTLASDGINLFAGGDLTSVGGVRRGYLAALSLTTGAGLAWDPNANNFVNALAIQGGVVYVGGGFTQVGGRPRNSIAAVDAVSGATSNWNPGSNNFVYALAASGNKVYVAGGFTQIGGQARNRLAALDVITSLPSSWNPNANNFVYALAVSGTTVYVGGQFTFIGGQVRSNIAALNLTTGLATTWSPSVDGTVQTLAVGTSAIYAGGGFTHVGAAARGNLAAIDRTTGAATSWDPEPDNYVQSVALASGVLYAGGDFAHVGVAARNALAGIDATTAQVLAWDPNANNFVQTVAVAGSRVFAGGFFSNVGGTGVTGIAAVPTAVAPPPPPTVSLLSPAGGETWGAGSTHDITWTATAASGVANVDLLYSTDSGATWPNVLAISLPNTGAYSWTLPDLNSTHVRVQVVAHDFVGQSSAATSASDFTIRRWTIVASAGAGGTVAPSGTTNLLQGDSQAYTIAADPHQHIAGVLVDGAGVGAVASYTFTNVTADHTLAASFAVDTYTIAASAGANGTISPAGNVTVNFGASQAFTMQPAAGHHVADVLVDDASVGAVTSYTFTNVGAAHTIAVSFAVDASQIAAVAPGVTLSPAHPTVAVPVNLSAVNPDPVRAFSVTLQLAGGVQLAAGTSSVTEGGFLSTGGAPTFFQVIDQGGGAYTVDGAILGAACGNTPASGTLFTLTLAATTPSGAGTGTVAITASKLRDCTNQDIAFADGPPAGVPIDYAAPAVTLTSPAGGEAWVLGSPHAITWTASDAAGVASVDLLLSDDGGVTFPTTIASALPNSGTYAWTAAPALTHGRVKAVAHDVNGNAGEGASAADFTVTALSLVTSAGPGGSVAPAGTTHPAYGSDVTVTLSPVAGFRVAGVLVDGVSVGAPTSYTFLAIATDHTLAATFADSTAPAVHVLLPNGGEGEVVGTSPLIKWTATDNVAVTNIDILLSRTGAGGPYDTLATAQPNTGQYTWTVTGPPSTHARVKVIAHDGDQNAGSDVSDADFSILATTGVDDGPVTAFALTPAAPNPVRSAARLRFDLPRESRVHLALVDVQGREVLVLADGVYAAGRHATMFSGGAGLGPGLYFARLVTAGQVFTQRVLVIR